MPGKNLIKIPSIFLLIGGIIGLIVYLIVGLLLSAATVSTNSGLGWIVVAVDVIWTILALLQVIAAIKGLTGCNKKAAAPSLKKWGIILLVVAVVAGIFNLVNAALTDSQMISVIIGIIFSFLFPILYICGAARNEKAQI